LRDASLDYFAFLHDLIQNTKHQRYFETEYVAEALERLNRPAQKLALRKEVYLQIIRSGIGLLNHLVVIVLLLLGWREGLSLGVMVMFIIYISSAFNFSLLFNTVLNNQSQLKFFEEKFLAIEQEIANLSEALSATDVDHQLIYELSAMINQLKPGTMLQIKALDDVHLYELVKELQADIGFVANDFHLFAGTVDENLTLFTSPSISESEIENALNIAKFPFSKRNLATIDGNGMRLS